MRRVDAKVADVERKDRRLMSRDDTLSSMLSGLERAARDVSRLGCALRLVEDEIWKDDVMPTTSRHRKNLKHDSISVHRDDPYFCLMR